jgi:hypothetical protein
MNTITNTIPQNNFEIAKQSTNSKLPSNTQNNEEKKSQENPEIKQNNLIFQLLKLTGLGMSLPLVAPSLLLQAENITKFGSKGEEGFIKFISSVISILTSPFRKIVNKLFSTDLNDTDVRSNKRSFKLDDFIQRILHPNFVKEVASFLYGIRRSLFNFSPKVFINPAEQRPSSDNSITKASSGLSAIFKIASGVTSPIRILSSAVTLLISIPSHLTGMISSYNGQQEIFNVSKIFSKISDIFIPITSNLSSLFRTSMALYDSSKGESLGVTFSRYNLNSLSAIQGILGGMLSFPGFFAALAETKDLILEKLLHSSKYKMADSFGEICAYALPYLKTFGFYSNHSEAQIKNITSDYLSNLIKNSNDKIENFLDRLYNFNTLTKKCASFFRPVDKKGNIIYRHSSDFHLEDPGGINVTNQGFSKKMFFNELHSLLHPIQSLIMLLPAAYTPIHDSYITDNGKLSIRLLDRILGINSFILSLPNYLIYALSTRLPQVLIKFYELKQKSSNFKGGQYNAFEAFQELKNKILNSGIPGTKYLFDVLNDLPINELTFQSSATTNKILSKLEEHAMEQEPSNKGTEILETFRAGAKELLARKNGFFYAKRDSNGYTEEEHNSMQIYKSLGTFKEGIAKLPIIGLIISPFIELIRSRYYVKARTDLATNSNP